MKIIYSIDAQPDRFDKRDYPFRSRLQAAPTRHQNENARTVGVLEQREGACTGYAAAGLINLLLYGHRQEESITHVSPSMLYHLARIYDEWEGEEYAGSSCRGVLKGWHHHGVCVESLWQDGAGWRPPEAEWAFDAVRHPIGAYYRVEVSSITDLRLAILEAGAVLVAGRIHDGWLSRLCDREPTPIDFASTTDASNPASIRMLGLHAFLLVGYDETGFVVQNSWGTFWGNNGFAVLTYRDWLENGVDAWVVSLGAPADPKQFASPPYRTGHGLLEVEEPAKSDSGISHRRGRRWSEIEARRHAVVFAKNGKPARRWVAFENGGSELRHHLAEIAKKASHLLVYFPGSLESEEQALQRIQEMGPRLEGEGGTESVTPFFVIWRTGFLDEVTDLVSTQLREKTGDADVANRPEARDRFFEVVARRFLRPLWTEVRSDAVNGSQQDGGLAILSNELRSINESLPQLRLHLAAHSAGVLPLAHLLRRMGPRGKQLAVPVTSCTLLAPLCSVDFAVRFFRQAFDGHVFEKGALYCEGLQDEFEMTDGVGEGLYGPSLPVLTSRVLERDCQTPILCLEELWEPSSSGQCWYDPTDAAGEWRYLRAVRDVRSKFLPGVRGMDGRRRENSGHRYLECDPNVLKRLVKHCLSSNAVRRSKS